MLMLIHTLNHPIGQIVKQTSLNSTQLKESSKGSLPKVTDEDLPDSLPSMSRIPNKTLVGKPSTLPRQVRCHRSLSCKNQQVIVI